MTDPQQPDDRAASDEQSDGSRPPLTTDEEVQDSDSIVDPTSS